MSNPMSTERDVTSATPALVFFSYGFRPFFFLAGLYAMVPVATILWALTAGGWPAGSLPLFVWHGHEMLFGFVAAAVAGFLLTAVATWTNTKAVSGFPLVGLVLLWIAGRVVTLPWVPETSVLAQIVGVAFFPALAVIVAVPIVRTKNFRNFPFIVLLGILFLGEIMFHARYFEWTVGPTFDGLRLTINTVTLMIVVVGGRITPAFTRNALVAMQRDVTIRSQKAIDIAAILFVVGVLIGDLLAVDSAWTGALAAIAAGLLLVRLTGWGGLRALDIPLLWVLHLGVLWLVIALTLKALWLLGGFSFAMNWMHAFTTGAFGTMILGVMTRVALGHTGRPLKVSRAVSISFALVSIAAIVRIFGPWLAPGSFTQVLTIAIGAWISAFGIFLVLYTPILFRPNR